MLLSIKKFTMSKITRKCTSEKDSPWTVIVVYTGLTIQVVNSDYYKRMERCMK